jgi:plastocyanin
LAPGADIQGTVVVEKKLTRRNVTNAAGAYQRGVAVDLATVPSQDSLAFERSHVAIYIDGAASQIASTDGVAGNIQQTHREFEPDFLVVPAGSTASFPNFDPIFHNVFSLSKPKSFDLGNYPKGQTRTLTFMRPGIVFVNCHLHQHGGFHRGEPDTLAHESWRGRPFRTDRSAAGKVHTYRLAQIRRVFPADGISQGRSRAGGPIGNALRRSFTFLSLTVKPMHLRTRTFLRSFLPFAFLFMASLWFVQWMVLRNVREQFRASARESQMSLDHQRTAAEQRHRRMLRIVAENPALKNGLELLLTKPGDAEAGRTVEEQLAEIGSELGFDLMLVFDPEGRALAEVMAQQGLSGTEP